MLKLLLPFRILLKEKKKAGGRVRKRVTASVRRIRKKSDCSMDILRGTDPNIRQVLVQ